ncbi:radical SAM family heme chaperone HemW [Xylocopilactobacillus apicola]|uniref:Heme chaperone HemW n=1 Tax=Xylocopilactobacillus apicola TaxID=2932184 RepID=A0AAU9CWK6_9LACO|nr:radical SAM family heme chaperone HemW [Xylocopilactobacillus apicola]BDR58349.1 coproporphyrinogen III oxidase [Xylocopilactobacillus apicola]
MTGIYIHIPFCDHICFYCDFPKVLKQGQPVDAYLRMLLKEIKKGLALRPTYLPETLYIGGGTPSAISSSQLAFLLGGIRELVDLNRLKEFSMETNPNDLNDLEKLKIMFDHGVKRISIGAQSFNDETLKRIGRTHDRNSIIKAVENAQQVGFKDISLDLMFRLPGQTFEEFKENLRQALDLGVNHLSIYSLILEQHTVFHNLLLEHRLKLPDYEQDRKMYEYAMEQLQKNGWHQYEISNFAKDGTESLHNKLYWQNENYFGFGAGAHGYLSGARIQNKQVIGSYINDLEINEMPILKTRQLTKQEQIEEEMFLGLRLNQGVDLVKSSLKFNVDLSNIYRDPIDELLAKGLIEQNESKIRLSSEGRYFANDVFSAFLLDKSARDNLTLEE